MKGLRYTLAGVDAGIVKRHRHMQRLTRESDYQMIRMKDIRTSGYQDNIITLISCYPGSHYLISCCPDYYKPYEHLCH